MTTPQPDNPANAPTIDDGGPAFPGEADRVLLSPNGEFRGVASHYVSPAEPGMSLRDYFAGQALQGVIASRIPLENNTAANPQMYASAAYAIADAMLAARKGGAQ